MTTAKSFPLTPPPDRTSTPEEEASDLPTPLISEAVTTIRYTHEGGQFAFGFSLPGTGKHTPIVSPYFEATVATLSPLSALTSNAVSPKLSAQRASVKKTRAQPIDVILPDEFDVESHTANLLDKDAWLRPPETGAYMGIFLRRGFGLPAPFPPYDKKRTFAEAAFYYYLKLLFPDTRDQAFGIVGHDVQLDLVIPSQRIAVEFDDPIREKHATLAEDIEKYAACRAKGIFLVRIKESRTLGDEDSADIIYSMPDILKQKNLQTILQKVIDALDPDCDCWNRFDAQAAKSRVQVGLRRDKGKIEASTMKLRGTSLAFRRPDLIPEWHPTKNAAIYPEMFTPDSTEPVWWHCPLCGSDYELAIADRVERDDVCPHCRHMASLIPSAKKIVQYTTDGRPVQTWESINYAAKHLHISPSNISLCTKGKRNHAGGFVWRFAGEPFILKIDED